MDLQKLIEEANLNDKYRDIPSLFKSCFNIISIDPSNEIAIVKIIYWASYTKSYLVILDLIEKVYNNESAMNKIQEYFYKENKVNIRSLMITAYMDIIKKKEELAKTNPDIYKYKCGDIFTHMQKLYDLFHNINTNDIISAYIEEKHHYDKYNLKN